ncbi:hypothetical protein D7O89_23635, partial [Salmonella enterica subsp. enterica serovar Typhimurium]|nr:hypothetical protein [Salmonella enterica subsp. enterica serovar Typhimurium]
IKRAGTNITVDNPNSCEGNRRQRLLIISAHRLIFRLYTSPFTLPPCRLHSLTPVTRLSQCQGIHSFAALM